MVWGYNETRSIRGEARCSYVSVFNKRWQVCSVYSWKVGKGEMVSLHVLQKDLKIQSQASREDTGLQFAFFRALF